MKFFMYGVIDLVIGIAIDISGGLWLRDALKDDDGYVKAEDDTTKMYFDMARVIFEDFPQLYLQYRFLTTGQGSLTNGWIMFFSMLSIFKLINDVVKKSVRSGNYPELNLLTFVFSLNKAWKIFEYDTFAKSTRFEGSACKRVFARILFAVLLLVGIFNFLYCAYLGCMLVLLACKVPFEDAKLWWWVFPLPYLLLQVYRTKRVRERLDEFTGILR